MTEQDAEGSCEEFWNEQLKAYQDACREDLVRLKERAGEVAAYTEIGFDEAFTWLARDGNPAGVCPLDTRQGRAVRDGDVDRMAQLPTGLVGDNWERENRVYWSYWSLSNVLGKPARACYYDRCSVDAIIEGSPSESLENLLVGGKCGPSTSQMEPIDPKPVPAHSSRRVWKEIQKAEYWMDLGLDKVFLRDTQVVLEEYLQRLTEVVVGEFDDVVQFLDSWGECLSAKDTRVGESVEIELVDDENYRLRYTESRRAQTVSKQEMGELLRLRKIRDWKY